MLRCYWTAAEDLTFDFLLINVSAELWLRTQFTDTVRSYSKESAKDKNDWRAETKATFSVVLLKNASSVSEINKKIRLCGIHKMCS